MRAAKSLLTGRNTHFCRHSRREARQIFLAVVEGDFYRDALRDFDEIAGAAVGFNQAEFGRGGGGDFRYRAVEKLPAERIDADARPARCARAAFPFP